MRVIRLRDRTGTPGGRARRARRLAAHFGRRCDPFIAAVTAPLASSGAATPAGATTRHGVCVSKHSPLSIPVTGPHEPEPFFVNNAESLIFT
jgi:hypothetical protein